MSGVGPTIGGGFLATTGTALGTQGLLPLTGVAVGLYVAIGVGLIAIGFIARRIAAARG
jgi:hypothetical protein